MKKLLALLAVGAVLGGGFAYVWSTEPGWWVRLWYPLRYEAIEGTPNLDLSEQVFPEREAPVSEEPVAEATEEPVAEVLEEEPPPEETDASIEADQAAPEEPGPGDSEGEPPAPPE